MAKATPQAYRVVGSPLAYNGKTAQPGDVLSDIPGQSISWLLAGGHIVATSDPVTNVSPIKPHFPAGAEIHTPPPETQNSPESAPEVESDPTEAPVAPVEGGQA